MLRHSFVHCPGIGLARERTLWELGYVDWDAFLDRHPPGGWRDRVAERLSPERAARDLPRREAWRLVPECAGRTLYLDVETDGSSGALTCIGVSDGVAAWAYVEGVDLERFPEALENVALLVTYNGTGFDLPILQRRFPEIDLRAFLHLDLRVPLHRLGLRGGLKTAEAACGVERSPAIQGADGWTAVLLWRAHGAGHPRALDTLRHYCLADAVNLKPLAAIAYNRLTAALPFPVLPVPEGLTPVIPHLPDGELVARLRGRA
ncbi:MAG TPA: ribonuclease H-like domain-containing protein [Candidatus Polarisedimenticolaceae bacterium]|nr:ribonuclease H-like domain-containing protein [Candidatus Polarisedimenticolaceae bacterium]